MQTAAISDEDIATQAHTSKLARTIAFGTGALLALAALGIGVAALTRSRRAGWLAGGAGVAVLAAIRWQLQRWFTDEPAYVVERRVGGLEIRRYAPHVEAQTRVSNLDFESALQDGFRRLASYIFGGNTQKKSLAMTTPVLNTPRANTHSVAFVMPPKRKLGSLPQPERDDIRLVDVPERRVAVLRFHGRYKDEVFQEQVDRLQDLISRANLEVIGQPTFAGFDPPSTLPWLRRTEIWVEVA